MGKLPIITLPDPVLRTESAPIERVDDDTRKLAADMLETMYAAPGIGLAGVQVAIPRRIFVMDAARDEDARDPFALINPEILSTGDTPRLHEEGCLSIPEFYAELERPARVRVRYLDLDGNLQERDFDDIAATIVQHEIDHLDGVLFIDYISRLKRDRVIKKFVKASKTDKADKTGKDKAESAL